MTALCRWLRQCLSLSVRWWQENAGSMEQRWPPLPDPAPSVPDPAPSVPVEEHSVRLDADRRFDEVRDGPIGDINEALARHELDFFLDRCREDEA